MSQYATNFSSHKALYDLINVKSLCVLSGVKVNSVNKTKTEPQRYSNYYIITLNKIMSYILFLNIQY